MDDLSPQEEHVVSERAVALQALEMCKRLITFLVGKGLLTSTEALAIDELSVMALKEAEGLDVPSAFEATRASLMTEASDTQR